MSAYTSLARYYDALTPDVPYERFADFYEEIFALMGAKVRTIADLACGTGTLTHILAERGYDLIGIDASEDMLAEAMNKLCDLAPMPLLICQRLEALDLYGTVDAAVCALDGMNYLPPDALMTALRRIHLFLEPGGLLIFDVNTPHKLRGLDGQVFLDEKEDIFCVWRAEFDREENACRYGIDLFTRQGKLWARHSEEHIEYAHEPSWLTERLSEAGFCDIRLFGDLEVHPPSEDAMRVFLAARKPQA
jgi:SAM-dependent methyltransferase